MWQAWVRREVDMRFWWENLQHQDLGVDGKIILKWMLREEDGKTCLLIWLRIGTGGELL
jgi:hypothetical protein